MMKLAKGWAAALLVALSAPIPGHADESAAICAGRDLMATLSNADRAQIARAVAATPYAAGTRWRATRDDAVIEIVGTYHFPDPRHAPVVAALRPLIAEAGALLVEVTPEGELQLTRALAQDPSLMVDADGPTLPERLPPEQWQQLGRAMEARGIPPIMASKMRPWYVATVLGLSPCMIETSRRRGASPDAAGLDHQLIAAAQDAGTSVLALEPWDSMFAIFAGLTPEEELDMIRAALPAAQLADDYAATTIEAYFRGDIWAIWEFSRLDALNSSDLPAETVAHQMQLAEERLMTARNGNWIAPLTKAAQEAATQGRHVVAAFGALHLPGENGVLRLLERDGWTIE
ncbi:TraB/GumN family protein [Paracoccus alkenifer]|uniref:TraB family protein n=1 Tax=Paracoccus alkenifer TaxID=65735 RepID=A0A1H6LQ61_9RHOB|nr:TraB/GumN family protein [Paracoccus alkenifer]SEH90834.1 hypothetical protein SAMN04488075_1756 [Paracoccus alkenifer]